MKNISISLLILIFFSGCKKEKELIEVALPDPDQIEEVVYANPNEVKTNEGPFKMKGLKYQYNSLEPYIDVKTMEIHYSKHHLGYANKLNAALKDSDFKTSNIIEILKNLDINNENLKNNAGGYYNHNLFFEILTKEKNTKPSQVFLDAVNEQFGSFNALKSEITNQANQVFGSGWVWIIIDSDKKLIITKTSNQDNPLMSNALQKGTPIFAIDLWEHAYYLKYNNSKSNYLENIFNVIDWKIVSKKYEDQLLIE